MFKEDIQPGYAPKELTFMGYTTKNLHHSEDAVKAFQNTIAKAHSGSIRQHQLVKDALMHTDQYMKLNDMHLEQGKAPDPAEIKQWLHMHEQARKDLEQLGEFPHHLDYWHNHLHELEAMLTNYNPEGSGKGELADSHNPEGTMVQEELTNKTIRSGDRVKVARVIADMLGVENAESMSPDTAVNAGLRKIKNKRMTPEFVGTVRKMVQLAQEVGIKVDQSAMPTAVTEDVVNKDSTFNAAKDILRFNDFKKLSKLNKGVVPVADKEPQSASGSVFGEEDGTEEQEKPAPEADEKDTLANVQTQVGATMTHPADDQLRRRKVAYKLGEWVELSEVSDSTLDKAWHGRYQQANTAKRGSPEWEKAHKSMGKIGDVMKKRTSDKLMHMAKHDPEAYKKSAVASADQDRKRGWSTESFDCELSEAADKVTIHMPGYPLHGKEASVFHRFDDGRVNAQVRHSMKKGDISNFTLKKDQYKEVAKEEAELEEDVHSADYKVSSSGHKYRARHIEFANSKMNAQPSRPEEEEGKVKHTKTEPIIKPVKEEYDDEGEHTEIDHLSDADLEKIADSIDTEDEILDVYDDSELCIVDQDTGEEIKEEVSEESLNEVLSRMERMKAKVRFARSQSKRTRRIQIALKSHSTTAKINDRARRLAIKLMKQRIAKKPVNQMSTSEKERVEKIVARRKVVINRLAMKLAPRIRKIENARLSHSKVTK